MRKHRWLSRWALVLLALAASLATSPGAEACEGCKFVCDIFVDEIWCYEYCSGDAALLSQNCTFQFPNYCLDSGPLCFRV